MHAGHYKTVGAQPALRFHWANISKQCAKCNNFLSASLDTYRPELVRRVGEQIVEYLEKDHYPMKLTIEDLDDIYHWFKMQKYILADRPLPKYIRDWLDG